MPRRHKNTNGNGAANGVRDGDASQRSDEVDAADESAPDAAAVGSASASALTAHHGHGSFAAPGSPSSLNGSAISSPRTQQRQQQLTVPSAAASSASAPAANSLRNSNGPSIFSASHGQLSSFRPPLHLHKARGGGEEGDSSEPSSAGSSARGGGHSASGTAISSNGGGAVGGTKRTASDLAAVLASRSGSASRGSSQQLAQMAMMDSGAGAVLRAISRPKAHSFDTVRPVRNNQTDSQFNIGEESTEPNVPAVQSSSSLNLLLSSHLSSLFPTPARSSGGTSASGRNLSVLVSPSPPAPGVAAAEESPGLLRSIFSPFVHWTPRGTMFYLLASLVLGRLIRASAQPHYRNRTMLTFGPYFFVREAPQLFALLIAFGVFRTAHQQRSCFPSIPLLLAWFVNATSLVRLWALFKHMVGPGGARPFREAMAEARIPLPQEDANAPEKEESVLTIAAATHDEKGEMHQRPVQAAVDPTEEMSSSLAASPSSAAFPPAASIPSDDPTAASAYRRLGKMTPLRWFLSATQLTKTLAWYEEVQWKTGVVYERIHAKNKTHALKMDIYRPKSTTGDAKPLPVFMYIHGGGWITGHRSFHSLALLYAICKSGWLVLSVSYRLSPWVKHPTHLMDCKRSLAFIKQNAAALGADPNTIVVGGESAGAHLACLLALTPNIPYLQPGFEAVDTRVAGVVDLYGPHDFTDSNFHFRSHEDPHSLLGGFDVFLHRMVMGTRLSSNPADYAMASPLHRLASFPDAVRSIPPFFGTHGAADDLVPVGDSDAFYRALRKKREQARREYEEDLARYEATKAALASSAADDDASSAPAAHHRRLLPPLEPLCLRHRDVYVRVPGASHAYNNIMSPRSFALNDSVTAWLLALLAARAEREAERSARRSLRRGFEQHSASALEDWSPHGGGASANFSARGGGPSGESAMALEEKRQAEEQERADAQQRQSKAAASAGPGSLFLLPKL